MGAKLVLSSLRQNKKSKPPSGLIPEYAPKSDLSLSPREH